MRQHEKENFAGMRIKADLDDIWQQNQVVIHKDGSKLFTLSSNKGLTEIEVNGVNLPLWARSIYIDN
jgi:hypothetical protein